MLYIAIPAHNEVETIGVLLWRLRTVLAEFPREYEVVVYDDASDDTSAEVLESYQKVLPLTIVRGERRKGYAGAVDALLRHVVAQTRHPRRDALLLMQGDFTDPPEIIPEFARRFEGGADLVVGERTTLADAPVAVHRLFRLSGWSMRPFVRMDGVRDMTSSMRLVRIAAIRDLMRERGDNLLLVGDTWTANADLLLGLASHSRRIETVPVQATYGVRVRTTRREPLRDSIAAFKWAWSARKRRVTMARSEAEPVRTRDVRQIRDSDDRDDLRERRSRDSRTRDRTRRERTKSMRDRGARPLVEKPATSTVPAASMAADSPESAERRERKRKRKRRSSSARGERTDLQLTVASDADSTAPIDSQTESRTGAAGADMDGGVAQDANFSEDSAELRERRRKRRRRRKPRAGGAAGDVTSEGSDSPEQDLSNADESTDDFVAEGGDAASALNPDGTPRKRRGRRGRRGGRRTRRTNGEGGQGESSAPEFEAPRDDRVGDE